MAIIRNLLSNNSAAEASSWRKADAVVMAVAVTAGLAIVPDSARAHVAPSVNANNRYLRLTPMRDRIRLAYTVYIGERPGADARQRMDGNRDGTLSQSEANTYGSELASAIAPALDITIDGASYPLTWHEQHVGLGIPSTRAGSFSIDLIAWICATDRGEHRAVIFDRYRLALPGETEVKVQKSPGITIKRSSLGHDQRGSQLDMKWRGNDGPMAKLGLYLEFAVDRERAAVPPGQHCDGSASAESDESDETAPKRNWPALIALLGAALAGLGWLLFRRRKSAHDES